MKGRGAACRARCRPHPVTCYATRCPARVGHGDVHIQYGVPPLDRALRFRGNPARPACPRYRSSPSQWHNDGNKVAVSGARSSGLATAPHAERRSNRPVGGEITVPSRKIVLPRNIVRRT